jgi:hypothetical protein
MRGFSDSQILDFQIDCFKLEKEFIDILANNRNKFQLRLMQTSKACKSVLVDR